MARVVEPTPDPPSSPQEHGTPGAPVYRKFKQGAGVATGFWGITVDEGWREWILCCDMYEWAADQLLSVLRSSDVKWRHGGN